MSSLKPKQLAKLLVKMHQEDTKPCFAIYDPDLYKLVGGNFDKVYLDKLTRKLGKLGFHFVKTRSDNAELLYHILPHEFISELTEDNIVDLRARWRAPANENKE